MRRSHDDDDGDERKEADDAPASLCPYSYIVVLDFEATCGRPRPIYPQEIIEFPVVVFDTRTQECVGEFQRYVRPVFNPVLTAFCTELTGIDQDTVDAGVSFETALEDCLAWLDSRAYSESAILLTCSDWDLNIMLPTQLRLCTPTRSCPALMRKWIDIQKVYRGATGNRGGLKRMLEGLGLPLEGRHHSGIDDCRNTARIVARLFEQGHGWRFTETGHASLWPSVSRQRLGGQSKTDTADDGDDGDDGDDNNKRKQRDEEDGKGSGVVHRRLRCDAALLPRPRKLQRRTGALRAVRDYERRQRPYIARWHFSTTASAVVRACPSDMRLCDWSQALNAAQC